jgi:hypothetical protein
MVAVRILSWIARLSGLGAVVLGLLFWFAQIDWISVHEVFGLLVTLSLLALSGMMISVRGGRILGIVGIIYAIIVPFVGEMQVQWYVSAATWLVPTIHLLIGIGAIGLAQVMATRYSRLKGAKRPSSIARSGELQVVE